MLAAFSFPIANWWTVAGVGVVAILLAVSAAWPRRRWRWRIPLGLAALVVAGIAVGAGYNAYYGYLRQFDELLGRRAADQAPDSVLTSAVVPEHGQVVELPIPATRSFFEAREAQVYLPPAWFERPRPELPVLMLFHGTPGAPEDWTRCCLADLTADRFAREHDGVAPVMVMPDINGGLLDDTECVNGTQGNAETYLVEDVRLWTIETFGTRSDGDSWALAGFSEGGMCSLLLALRHPDKFQTFVDLSGLAGPEFGSDTLQDLFAGNRAASEEHQPARLLRERRYDGMGGWFEVGTDDTDPYRAALELAPLARQAGIDTCLVVVEGAHHNSWLWQPAFAGAFDWIAARLGIVEETPAMTASCEPPR